VNDPNPSSVSNRSQLNREYPACFIITVYNDGKLLRMQICNKLASMNFVIFIPSGRSGSERER
jgi:hypothetical protein